MITKTKLVKRIFSSLLTAALAVPMTALTAHYAGRDRINERNKRSDKRKQHTAYCCRKDSYYRSVSCDSNAGNGLTVCCVRTATEQCTCDRTYTVAEKRSCKTRLFKKVMVDNRRKVFMVSNVFCKNNKCNRHIGYKYSSKICEVELLKTFQT